MNDNANLISKQFTSFHNQYIFLFSGTATLWHKESLLPPTCSPSYWWAHHVSGWWENTVMFVNITACTPCMSTWTVLHFTADCSAPWPTGALRPGHNGSVGYFLQVLLSNEILEQKTESQQMFVVPFQRGFYCIAVLQFAFVGCWFCLCCNKSCNAQVEKEHQLSSIRSLQVTFKWLSKKSVIKNNPWARETKPQWNFSVNNCQEGINFGRSHRTLHLAVASCWNIQYCCHSTTARSAESHSKGHGAAYTNKTLISTEKPMFEHMASTAYTQDPCHVNRRARKRTTDPQLTNRGQCRDGLLTDTIAPASQMSWTIHLCFHGLNV